MGLGILRGSLVSAVADGIGDDGPDSLTRIRSLINVSGPGFCNLGNFKFLRSDISYNITQAGGFVYSGASYLPATFKEVIASKLVDSGDCVYPIYEKGIQEAYRWDAVNYCERPTKFAITRNESGFYEAKYNFTPDATYTHHLEIAQQWADVTSDASEVLVTKDYFEEFSHYLTMQALKNQGDSENYLIYKNEWDGDPIRHKTGMLTRLLKKLRSPNRKSSIVPVVGNAEHRDPDYNISGHDLYQNGIKPSAGDY